MGLLDRWRSAVAPIAEIGPSSQQAMLPGGYAVKLVGEAYYQSALDSVCGGRTEDGHARECIAVLVPEPRNPHDRNAVAGWIEGQQVGHLSRDDAHRYQPVARRLSAIDAVGACAALILGGWDRGRNDTGHYGVTLSLAPPGRCLQLLDGQLAPDADPWHVLRNERGYRARLDRAQARAVDQAGMVQGRYYSEWVPVLDRLRAEKRDDQALPMLIEIISAVERVAEVTGQAPSPSFTERAAVIYRRQENYAAEVAVLERWEAACPPGSRHDRFEGRLAKARSLASGHG